MTTIKGRTLSNTPAHVLTQAADGTKLITPVAALAQVVAGQQAASPAPSGGATGANPTATASDTAVNGTATTFLRSDGAPAVQKCSSSVFGLAKVDGTTITASGGVITAVGGSGALTLVSTLTAAASAGLAWTGLTGAAWRLTGTLLLPATSGAFLEIQYGTGAGPTYHAAGYYLGGALNAVTAAVATSNVTQDNKSAFVGEQQTNTQQGASFVLDILTDNANWVHMLGQIIYARLDGTTMVETIGGIVAISAQLTAIQLFENSGNITSGKASLYSVAT